MAKTDRIAVIELVAGFSVEKPLGGIERFVFELCPRIDPACFSVAIYGLWNFEAEYKLRWLRMLKEAGIETFEGSPWRPGSPYRAFIETFRILKQTLSSRHFDIIHSHDQFGDIMGLMLKQQFRGVRLVRTVQNQREWHRRPLRRALLWWGLYPWLYDAEIGVNARIVNDLNGRATARLLRKQAVYIPNALNIERFQREYGPLQARKAELGLPPGAVLVGTIGRLTAQKGYADFLQAAALVSQRAGQAYFVMVGAGELEADLRQQADALGLAQRVIFAGTRADIERYIHSFDLFVSSSLWEGLPTVIMESMAAGIPVVATDIPGSRDLIQTGRNGWLAPPGDPTALAETILLALDSAQQREDFARQALTDVAPYSITQAARRQEQVYFSLVGSRGDPCESG